MGIKRFLINFMILLLALSTTVSTYACEIIDSGVYRTAVISDGKGVPLKFPRSEKIHFDTSINNSNSDTFFSVNPSSGKNLNIYVQNSSAYPVTFEVYIAGARLAGYPVTVEAGKASIFTSSNVMYTATWRAVVNQPNGYNLEEVRVRARQYT